MEVALRLVVCWYLLFLPQLAAAPASAHEDQKSPQLFLAMLPSATVCYMSSTRSFHLQPVVIVVGMCVTTHARYHAKSALPKRRLTTTNSKLVAVRGRRLSGIRRERATPSAHRSRRLCQCGVLVAVRSQDRNQPPTAPTLFYNCLAMHILKPRGCAKERAVMLSTHVGISMPHHHKMFLLRKHERVCRIRCGCPCW
jgi:hypothetical protein